MTNMERPARAWLGVVQAAHVQKARELGIAQINHGKRTNLGRMRRGDGLVYYSPRDRLGGKPLRAFTAAGIIADDDLYLGEAGADGFRPWRRRVTYAEATPVALAEIGGELSVIGSADWRFGLRFGLIPLPVDDFITLRDAMTGRAYPAAATLRGLDDVALTTPATHR